MSKLYLAPTDSTTTRTYQAFYEDWKDVSNSIRRTHKEVSRKIERELGLRDQLEFIPITFTKEEAQVIKG